MLTSTLGSKPLGTRYEGSSALAMLQVCGGVSAIAGGYVDIETHASVTFLNAADMVSDDVGGEGETRTRFSWHIGKGEPKYDISDIVTRT